MVLDYEKHVWVRETVTFSNFKSWIELDGPLPLDSVKNMDKIVFSLWDLSRDVTSVTIYDMD